MKERISRLRGRYRTDFRFKTFFSSACSVLSGLGFALFHAVLGIVSKSVWHGSISVYYMLLTTVRGIIVFSRSGPGASAPGKTGKLCAVTHTIMIVTDLCLIAPIAFTVMGERTYPFGLIPAITMAAYTTYRITMGAIHYRSSRKQDDPLVKELRVINLQDALVAVLSLQNALIIANGSSAASMIRLTGWTSAAIWLTIVFFTVRSFPGGGNTPARRPRSRKRFGPPQARRLLCPCRKQKHEPGGIEK